MRQSSCEGSGRSGNGKGGKRGGDGQRRDRRMDGRREDSGASTGFELMHNRHMVRGVS